MNTTREKIKRRWKIIKSNFGWEDGIALALIVLGVIGYIKGPIPLIPGWTEFYFDNRSSLISIGITVLIIDNVNELYRRRAEKERLILQMGSPDNGFAVEAVRQLESRGWMKDGSLTGAYLGRADLRGAILTGSQMDKVVLIKANLEGATLAYTSLNEASLCAANLRNTSLRGIKMKGTNLSGIYYQEKRGRKVITKTSIDYKEGADLSGAVLENATLDEADLTGAKVSNSQLAQAKSLERATMPDGKVYDPAIHTELARLRKEAGWDHDD